MDELETDYEIWSLGDGWMVGMDDTSSIPGECVVYDVYHNEGQYFGKIACDVRIPDGLFEIHLMHLIYAEIERGEIVMMAGGGDVRPEPDGD